MKATIDGVVYDGTPAEICSLVRELAKKESQTPAPCSGKLCKHKKESCPRHKAYLKTRNKPVESVDTCNWSNKSPYATVETCD